MTCLSRKSRKYKILYRCCAYYVDKNDQSSNYKKTGRINAD